MFVSIGVSCQLEYICTYYVTNPLEHGRYFLLKICNHLFVQRKSLPFKECPIILIYSYKKAPLNTI